MNAMKIYSNKRIIFKTSLYLKAQSKKSFYIERVRDQMFRVPRVQLLVVPIISELCIFLVRLYELNRFQVRKFTVQIVQIKHETNRRVL